MCRGGLAAGDTDADPPPEVPNPAWTALDSKGRQPYARLDRLQAEYGLEAFTNLEPQRRTLRGFMIAPGKLGRQIEDALQQVTTREARRGQAPRRLPVSATTEQPVVKLAPERQRRANLIKMDPTDSLARLPAPSVIANVDCGDPPPVPGKTVGSCRTGRRRCRGCRS